MNLHSRIVIGGLVASLLMFATFPAAAQQPKSEKKAGKSEKKADAASDKPSNKNTESEAVPEDSAVAAILATKPATPAQRATAAHTLAALGHPDLAKDFLKQILDAKLDSEQLADLGEQLGTATFMEMSDRASLQPEAEKLYRAVAAAVAKRLEGAQRIAGLIRQLQNPSAEKRLQAVAGLQEARDAGIRALVEAMADPARSAEHAAVRAALVEMGPPARRPLMTLTERVDPKLAIQAIEVLGDMNESRAAIALLGPCLTEKGDAAVRTAAADALKRLTGGVPTRAEAVGRLTAAARAYLDGREPIEGAVEGNVVVWRWDPSRRRCVSRRATVDEAARALAARWARDAFAVAPEDRAVRSLYLTATLEAAAYENGLDRPLDSTKFTAEIQEAKRLGIPALEGAMDFAATHGHFAAAAAAARLLGQIGDARELLYQSAGPAPLVRAVRSSDRRLQLAAAEAIVRLAPTRPFAGASYVLDALGFLAAGRGVRGALVAFPSAQDARDIAGRLAAEGFHADAFFNGKDLVFQAAKSPDYELALIDATIDRPTIDVLLQQLRHDPRTASLRVGVIARDGYLDRAEHAAEHDWRSRAFARPRDDRAVRWQLEQLAAVAPSEFVETAARQRQAVRALELLAEIGRSDGRLYDLRRVEQPVLDALPYPKLSRKAAAVLAGVNSAEAQRALVHLVGRDTLPAAARQAAVRAFRENVERYGVLLAPGDIRRLYDLLPTIDKRDVETRKMLGLILNTIEASSPRKKAGQEK